LVALIVFSPVIIWNWRHDWASFRFQIGHGLASENRSGVMMFLEWLAGQALVVTPVLFVMVIAVLVISWRKFRALGEQEWVLLWCATIPLLFFGYTATRSR